MQIIEWLPEFQNLRGKKTKVRRRVENAENAILTGVYGEKGSEKTSFVLRIKWKQGAI
jgi:hypothetical protein